MENKDDTTTTTATPAPTTDARSATSTASVTSAPLTGTTTLGPAPRQTDVPTVRALRDYDFVPNQPTPLSPTPGYAGCIALVPRGGSELEVALFVSNSLPGGITWAPPLGTVIMDVPAGFAINDGDAILEWLNRSIGHGKPGSTGSVKGRP